jgi:hypothetical protein
LSGIADRKLFIGGWTVAWFPGRYWDYAADGTVRTRWVNSNANDDGMSYWKATFEGGKHRVNHYSDKACTKRANAWLPDKSRFIEDGVVWELSRGRKHLIGADGKVVGTKRK